MMARLFLSVLVGLGLLVFCAGNVFAQDSSSDVKPLPNLLLMSSDEFAGLTNLYQQSPGQDEALTYEINIPKDWTKISDIETQEGAFEISTKVFTQLAQFTSSPRMNVARSRLSIDVIELDYKLSAQQWLMQYISSNSYTLQGLDVLSDRLVDVLFVILEHDTSYIVRARVAVNGKKVVLIRYFLPIDNWANEKSMQAQVVSSFSLKNVVTQVVEDTKKFEFLDIAEIHYPSSWELRSSPFKSIDRMNADLLNIPGLNSAAAGSKKGQVVLDGKISVNLVSAYVAESLEDEMSLFRDELKKQGLILGDAIDTENDYLFNDAFDFATIDVYKAEDENDKLLHYELWITMMGASDYYYFVTLLTPSREDEYYTWVRNAETYRSVLESIKPNVDSLTQQ